MSFFEALDLAANMTAVASAYPKGLNNSLAKLLLSGARRTMVAF